MRRPSFPARRSRHLSRAVSTAVQRLRPRPRSRSGQRQHDMIEELESRRMLAVFNGTSGSDDITLYTSAGVPHVMINGSDHSTLDSTVQVNCGSGDDNVHMLDWVPGTVVDLGGGWNQVYYGG